MKILLLITVMLSGCRDSVRYTTVMCSKNETGCKVGDLWFQSIENCEAFNTKASKFQPEVGRFCIQVP